jgi:hypothetical protein
MESPANLPANNETRTKMENDTTALFLIVKTKIWSREKSSASKTTTYTLRADKLKYEQVLVGSMGQGNENIKKDKTLKEDEIQRIKNHFKINFPIAKQAVQLENEEMEVLELSLSGKYGGESFEYRLSGGKALIAQDWHKKVEGLIALLAEILG